MIIDRLFEEIEKKGQVCLGLDTHMDYIPEIMKNEYKNVEDIIFQFNKKIIDASYDIVSIYKLQIAYYEAYGIEGLKAYKRTLAYLREKNILSIGDVKRGDIADTGKMYAHAHFSGDFEADFITINPYMGYDSISPYLEYLERGDKGIFVLLRTSNPGAKDIEYLKSDNMEIYYHVGDRLAEMGEKFIGKHGYSLIGAVVGGTHKEEAEEIRKRYKNMFFLIPGYGAQGARGEDIRQYLNDANGGVVNSSRGIIKYYMQFEDGVERFEHYTREAIFKMREDINEK